MTNQNSSEYLDKNWCAFAPKDELGLSRLLYSVRILENLRMLPHSPGVQMQPVPDDAIKNLNEDVEQEVSVPRLGISAAHMSHCVCDVLQKREEEDELAVFCSYVQLSYAMGAETRLPFRFSF